MLEVFAEEIFSRLTSLQVEIAAELHELAPLSFILLLTRFVGKLEKDVVVRNNGRHCSCYHSVHTGEQIAGHIRYINPPTPHPPHIHTVV